MLHGDQIEQHLSAEISRTRELGLSQPHHNLAEIPIPGLAVGTRGQEQPRRLFIGNLERWNVRALVRWGRRLRIQGRQVEGEYLIALGQRIAIERHDTV